MITAVTNSHLVSNMLNKLHGQPESYDKKYTSQSCAEEHADRLADQDIDSVEHSELVHMVSSERQMARLERLRLRSSSRRM
jgi:hypothetical protein